MLEEPSHKVRLSCTRQRNVNQVDVSMQLTLSSHTALISRSPPLPKSRLLSMKPAPMSALQTSGNSPFSASSMSSSDGFSPAASRARTVSTSPVLIASLRDLSLASGCFFASNICAVLPSVRTILDGYNACGERLRQQHEVDDQRLLEMGTITRKWR